MGNSTHYDNCATTKTTVRVQQLVSSPEACSKTKTYARIMKCSSQPRKSDHESVKLSHCDSQKTCFHYSFQKGSSQATTFLRGATISLTK